MTQIQEIYLQLEDWYWTRLSEKGSPFWPLWWLVGPLVRRLGKRSHWSHCPRCGYDGFDFYEEPFFECTNGGDCWGPDGTVYWFEGVQTCPRCRHRYPVSDSS